MEGKIQNFLKIYKYLINYNIHAKMLTNTSSHISHLGKGQS